MPSNAVLYLNIFNRILLTNKLPKEFFVKKLHLVCNAHLDPVWMWDWDEGACAALGTFYSAIDLMKDNDYIFCHNEAVLYKYIEEYSPKLFKEIQEAVKSGKWHIMGGWFLQPDCMLPSGESFIRQITTGREYFEKHFGSKPAVAVNFDSFGHTKGLVQILKKCGYDGYIFCRPMPNILKLPDEPFIWKGYDGSEIKAIRINDQTLYCTDLGHAKENILRKVKPFEGQEEGIALWGVGNHGGGASRKDLSDIAELIREKKGEYEIVHSTPELYFENANPSVVIDTALPCFIKSYSSISRLKQANAFLENQLFKTEKALSAAEISGRYDYDVEKIRECEYVLCGLQFHDVLSGTCAVNGEETTLKKVEYAKEILSEEFYKAFHALAKDLPSAKSGENPFVIFNFQPYEYETVIETEFLIPEILISNTEMNKITVYQNGKEIPSQVIKELSNINYDRRKRIAYKCRLAPLGITEVIVKYERIKGQRQKPITGGDISVKTANGVAHIDVSTGLLDSFIVNGKEYLSGGAFAPVIFDDNEDPWGWDMVKLGKNHRKVGKLVQCKVVEDGEVFTEVESIFASKTSKIKLSQKIYKDFDAIDVNLVVLWNEEGKGLKLKVPTQKSGKYFGQVAFGTENYKADGGENVYQRFIGVDMGEKSLAVLSSGVYSCSKSKKDLYLTLLNGSVYCAHPIGDRPLVDKERFVDYIENGKHRFDFRLIVDDKESIERRAQEFAETPYSVNMYPHGDGKISQNEIVLEGDKVVLTSLRKSVSGGYIIRLFNNNSRRNSCCLKIRDTVKILTIGKYSFVTLYYNGKKIEVSENSDLY